MALTSVADAEEGGAQMRSSRSAQPLSPTLRRVWLAGLGALSQAVGSTGGERGADLGIRSAQQRGHRVPGGVAGEEQGRAGEPLETGGADLLRASPGRHLLSRVSIRRRGAALQGGRGSREVGGDEADGLG